MKFTWILAEPKPQLCAELAAALDISPLLAQCLVNRGLREPASCSQFLQPRLKNLADPFDLPNMAAAVERLLAARERRERVVIFGDYDVDGVSSTALLAETLGAMGWRVEFHLPRRLNEGYGLSAEGVERCLQNCPASLLLAVDCGSTSVHVALALKQRGVDVLVLDHHQVSNPPPPVVALVNPQLGGRFHELCSAGLAFKLVHALLKRMRDLGVPEAAALDLRPTLDLVALGTIADQVPLTGENRILAAAGLDQLNETRRPGILALKAVASCGPIMDSYDVAFQLAPRLNAAGRLEDACGALTLLLTKDPGEAETLALGLDKSNRQRQAIERAISDEITAMIRPTFDAAKDYVIVAGRAEWHIGVVGIVAARLVQQFHRPAVVFGGDGASWRGSGRSIDGFDLAAALRGCSDLLLHHGGHAMAAGASIEPAKLESFRRRLNDMVCAALTGEELRPRLKLDAVVAASGMTLSQVEELARLDPVGQGNPAVRLTLPGLIRTGPPQRMGRENQHAKFCVADGDGTVLEAVWWNCREAPMPPDPFDLAFTPQINTYKGRTYVQLKILDWRPSTPTPGQPPL